ncbi:hypothetical protein SH611_01905 [Geminicoccaceae bacterium 1502E]|nr:hypothetical protein [Geminicoccaceae bacterium 1502E]
MPWGEIVAVAARGTLMGNRGILHDARRELGPARWRHPHWVACVLSFRFRHRRVMTPGRYTELFFLDEAVALAAGHRPCAECRRADFRRFAESWQAAFGGERPRAGDIDRVLHRARVEPRTRRQIRHTAPLARLPEGVFVRLAADGPALLVLGDALLPFAPEGYGAPLPRPEGATAEVLTPAPTIAVLAASYRPMLHPSVRAENAARA